MSTKPEARVSGRPVRLPPVIFICYRREDAEAFAAMVHLKLESHFGSRANVFWDHGDIGYGDDFPEKIKEALKASRALVAVIGSRWLDVRDKQTGGRRLDNEKDYVRVEIASALSAGVPVIPVLVEDAAPPEAEDLPPDLRPLATKNALFIRGVRHFDRDVKDLIEELEKRLPKRREPRPEEHGLFKMFEGYSEKGASPGEELLRGEPPLGVRLGAVVAFIIITVFIFNIDSCRGF